MMAPSKCASPETSSPKAPPVKRPKQSSSDYSEPMEDVVAHTSSAEAPSVKLPKGLSWQYSCSMKGLSGFWASELSSGSWDQQVPVQQVHGGFVTKPQISDDVRLFLNQRIISKLSIWYFMTFLNANTTDTEAGDYLIQRPKAAPPLVFQTRMVEGQKTGQNIALLVQERKDEFRRRYEHVILTGEPCSDDFNARFTLFSTIVFNCGWRDHLLQQIAASKGGK